MSTSSRRSAYAVACTLLSLCATIDLSFGTISLGNDPLSTKSTRSPTTVEVETMDEVPGGLSAADWSSILDAHQGYIHCAV